MASEDLGEDMAKAAASTAVQLFLGPVADVGKDLIGGTIGDRIAVWRRSKPEWQARNSMEVAERARRIRGAVAA